MVTRYTEPVSDGTVCKSDVPEITKATTECGKLSWSDSAASRCVFTADESGLPILLHHCWI